MNILLVYANTHQLLWPQPAGLSLIARACREAGHQVRVVDLLFEKDPDATLASALSGEKPDLIGLSLRNLDNADLKNTVSFVGDYVKWVAACNAVAPTLIGGPAVTSSGGEPLYRRTGATWAMTGQGERSVPIFLEELAAGATTFKAPGLIWREGGAIRRNPPDLGGHDRGIDWSVIERKKYDRPYMAHGLLTKSGCAHRCMFCDAPVTAGSKFMPRPPEQIVEDVRREAREWKINKREYMLIDPCFNQPLDWSKEVLEAFIRSGLRIRFAAIVEPTGDIDREFCRLMVRAGNTMVTGLVGSADDGVLSEGRRPFSSADIAHAFELFESEKVLYMPQFMFGGPGETRETVERTIAFMRRFRPIMMQAGLGVRIYPLAPIRERAVAEAQVAEGDDLLEPRFYVSRNLDVEWATRRLESFKPRRLAAAGKWCRYLWRMSA